jgi:hypothetical protein
MLRYSGFGRSWMRIGSQSNSFSQVGPAQRKYPYAKIVGNQIDSAEVETGSEGSGMAAGTKSTCYPLLYTIGFAGLF